MPITEIDITDELKTLKLPELPSLSKTLTEKKIDTTPEEELGDLTDEEFAELASEAARVNAALEALEARKEELKATARRLDYGPNKRASSLGTISIGRNPQFDKEKFLEEKPFDYYEIQKVVDQDEDGNDVVRSVLRYPNRELYKIEPDRPAIKKLLSKEEAESFYYEGTKKVTFK